MGTQSNSIGTQAKLKQTIQRFAPVANAAADVVIIHGLPGNPYDTWTHERSRVFWPAQLLPFVLHGESVHMLIYGYEVDIISFTVSGSDDKIHKHGEQLFAQIVANRRL